MWQEPGALWVQILHGKYRKDEVFTGHNGRVKNCSFWWKGIHSLFGKFCDGISWQIGNGNAIRFWLDKWLDNYTLVDVASRRPPDPMLTNTITDMVDANGTWRWDIFYDLLDIPWSCGSEMSTSARRALTLI
ncbi:hypothetical protein M5689_020343 [Euphorbia peplus]|nr:hypothetical protein M5689_020343 [Euphorbia peplus]